MISARTVELAGTQGTIDTADGARLTLSGTVSGAASLMKEGNGTLVLNGTNSYAGHTSVNAGTLIGNAGSIAATWSITARRCSTRRSREPSPEGRRQWSGDQARRRRVDPGGKQQRPMAGGCRHAGQLGLALHRRCRYRRRRHDDVRSDRQCRLWRHYVRFGTLLKTDSGLLELSANSGDFAGTTTVAAGTLRVTNKLGGTVAVDDGASVGGSGIGALTGAVSIADGGTLLGRQGETLTMGSLTLERSRQSQCRPRRAGHAGAVRRDRQPDA